MRFNWSSVFLVLALVVFLQNCAETSVEPNDVQVGSFYEPKIDWEMETCLRLHEEVTLSIALSFPEHILDSLDYYGVDSLDMYAMYIGDSSYYEYEFGEIIWEEVVDVHTVTTFELPVRPEVSGNLAMWLAFLVVREDPNDPLRYHNLINNTLYFYVYVDDESCL